MDEALQNYHDLESAIGHAIRCKELEEKELGKTNLHYIGSCLSISNLFLLKHDFNSVMKYCEEGLSLLQQPNLNNNYYEYFLRKNRVEASIGIGLLYTANEDIARLNLLLRIFDDKKEAKLNKAIVYTLKSKVLIAKKEDRDKSISLTSEAFNLLKEIYSPNDEESYALLMTNCLDLIEHVAPTELQAELIKSALSKDLAPADRGMFLSYLADLTQDLEYAEKLRHESDSLLVDSQYVNCYYANKLRLAKIEASKNNFDKAIGRCIQVRDYFRAENPNTPAYRNALETLGDLYFAMGQAAKASEAYEELVNKLSNDKDNPEYVFALLKLGVILDSLYTTTPAAKKDEAYKKGYEIGKEIRELNPSIINWSDLVARNISIGFLAESILPFIKWVLRNYTINYGVTASDIERFIDKLLDELIASYGLKNHIVCDTMFCLASIKYIQGKHDEAIKLANQVVEISKEQGWPYAHRLADLAFFQYDSGDTHNALDSFRVGFEFKRDDILKKYRWMSLNERTAYTNSQRGYIDNLPRYAALTPDDRRYAELAYDALLFSKGLLLNSSIELTRLLNEEGDTETLRQLELWRKISQELESMENKNGEEAENLRRRVNTMEKQLIAKSRTFGDYTNGLAISFRQVQTALDDYDVAIEFCSYQKDIKHRNYGALILKKDSNPIYVDIGNDSLWAHIGLAGECYNSEELFNLLFGSLKEFLPTKEQGNVYFAADGQLHTIAIENLPGSEKYNLLRLSSTRELTMENNDTSSVSELVLFGGINYGMGKIAALYPVSRTGHRDSDEFLIDLPGTKEEAENICNLLSDKININLHTGDEATKTRFISYSGKKPNIIHIATHGFFNSHSPQDAMENPLLNSGLYFAGAQNTIYGEDLGNVPDNGLLTSLEISALDFRGLRIAVLSACETGLGQIGPDGVFGLQRAFKQAGAKCLLMSLWKVNDNATQMLMSEFYKNLVNGRYQYEALVDARNSVRRKFPDPKDWASFIILDANNHLNF